MKENEQVGKLWWAVPAATILLLAMLAMIFGNPEQRQPGTSYDASAGGFRAAYLLLDELGYPVTRARRLGGPEIRWLLFPAKATPKDAKRLDEWVRAGGVLLFADNTDEFAGQMGIPLKFETLEDADDEEAVRGPVGKGEHLAGGKTWIDWPGQNGKVLARAGDKPVITVYRHGQGQIWLVQRPEFVSNNLMRKANNGVVLCRLAEAMLADKPGQIAFDEYFHGMRDRPSVTALLLQQPASWGTYHGLLLLAVLLWHYVPRFGAVRPVPGPARRSQQEFLDAMASLLDRKRDYAAAWLSVRTAFVRELERVLGLPANAPVEQLVESAAQRRPIDREKLQRLLTAAPAGGASAFIQAMNEMETARDEFCQRRQFQ